MMISNSSARVPMHIGVSCAFAGLLWACADRTESSEPSSPVSEHELRALASMLAEHVMPETVPDAGLPPDGAEPELLGDFELTYYWMAHERKGHIERDVQLFNHHCQPLAMVSQAFERRLGMEGTGRLRDGRTLNAAGMCDCDGQGSVPCFYVVARSKRWGVGVAKRPLSPYRSVAVDLGEIPVGTMLYIPALDGLTMPGRAPYGGFVHNGCVVADDTGGNVGRDQIDLFMAFEAHYAAFDRRHRLKRVRVYDGRQRCGDNAVENPVPVHRNAT